VSPSQYRSCRWAPSSAISSTMLRSPRTARSAARGRAMNDLVIRGATVIDGLGNDPRRVYVAVKDGRIAAIGDIKDSGAKTIDAGGLALSPGLVDIHTHYDAQ